MRTRRGIKAAIDAHTSGDSMEKNEQAVASLKRIGWDRPLLITMVQLTDQKPSLRQILRRVGRAPRGHDRD